MGPGSIQGVQSEAARGKSRDPTGNKTTEQVQGPTGDRTENWHTCDVVQAKSEGPSLSLNGTSGPMGKVHGWDTQMKLLRAFRPNYYTQKPDIFHVRPQKISTMLL